MTSTIYAVAVCWVLPLGNKSCNLPRSIPFFSSAEACQHWRDHNVAQDNAKQTAFCVKKDVPTWEPVR
ncbi:hypothetical protein [Bradyrhizobium sp. ARR65]|uniref:hypothetical protein n=1 Tax=Bradyrhizobium sp. ARR65 TaxID=1040989 RepID=UPI000466376C|nr:hypothetical protein [Bradyrhizobium sp. ARR65]